MEQYKKFVLFGSRMLKKRVRSLNNTNKLYYLALREPPVKNNTKNLYNSTDPTEISADPMVIHDLFARCIVPCDLCDTFQGDLRCESATYATAPKQPKTIPPRHFSVSRTLHSVYDKVTGEFEKLSESGRWRGRNMDEGSRVSLVPSTN